MIKRLLEKYIHLQLHPNKINTSIDKIIDEYPYCKQVQHSTRVACVQRQIKPVTKIDDFILEIYSIVKSSAQQGASYIIFPEYNFFDLFGIIPGFSSINQYLNKRTLHNQPDEQTNNKRDMKIIYYLFDLFSKPTELAILTMMSRLANVFHMYIYTGTYIFKNNDKLLNRGTLIGPNGEIMMNQDKVHLTDFEADLGLDRQCFFQVFSLPIGNVAFPICMDASFFETFKLTEKLGVEIVVIPIANNEEYNQWRALRGIWSRVQETYVYGIKSSLNGWIGGMHFTGKAGIFAPIMMTDKRDGVVAIAHSAEGNELIYADLDVKILSKAKMESEYNGDMNVEFEKNYYEKTYIRKRE